MSDSIVTPVGIRAGRSMGNTNPDNEYYVEITDRRSGAQIARLTMSGKEYASMLTGGGAISYGDFISPQAYATAVGKFRCFGSVELRHDWNGTGLYGQKAVEELRAILDGMGAKSSIGCDTLNINLRRDGINVIAIAHGRTPSDAVNTGAILLAELLQALEAAGAKAAVSARSYPETAMEAMRDEA